MTRNAKSNYYKDCLSNNFKNPKQFWNNIKDLVNTSDKCIIKQIKVKTQLSMILFLLPKYLVIFFYCLL